MSADYDPKDKTKSSEGTEPDEDAISDEELDDAIGAGETWTEGQSGPEWC